MDNLKDGSLAIMNRITPVIEDNSNLPETTEHNYQCKVIEEGVSVWKILCQQCRNSYSGYKRVSFSDFDCENCGHKAINYKEKP